MIQLQPYAVLLHVVGILEIELQYYTAVYVCTYACERTRYIYYHVIHTLRRQTAITAVVLQLLALSAAACLTLYTAV